MHQFLYMGIVVFENSVRFVGTYVLSEMIGPVMDHILNDY
jgi:hypothetical protein